MLRHAAFNSIPSHGYLPALAVSWSSFSRQIPSSDTALSSVLFVESETSCPFDHLSIVRIEKPVSRASLNLPSLFIIAEYMPQVFRKSNPQNATGATSDAGMMMRDC